MGPVRKADPTLFGSLNAILFPFNIMFGSSRKWQTGELICMSTKKLFIGCASNKAYDRFPVQGLWDAIRPTRSIASRSSGGGKRIAATLTQLGYPTKNALKAWYQEYEQRQDVSMGYARSRLKYSAEQKQIAVDHYQDHGRCIASTLKALGYPCKGTLTSWIDELSPETRKHLVSKGSGVVHSETFKNAAVIDLCMRAPLLSKNHKKLRRRKKQKKTEVYASSKSAKIVVVAGQGN
jgi:transposase-like protein